MSKMKTGAPKNAAPDKSALVGFTECGNDEGAFATYIEEVVPRYYIARNLAIGSRTMSKISHDENFEAQTRLAIHRFINDDFGTSTKSYQLVKLGIYPTAYGNLFVGVTAFTPSTLAVVLKDEMEEITMEEITAYLK